MPRAFVVRASLDYSKIYASLESGLARIGWSSLDEQNLRVVVDRATREGRQSLNASQEEAWRCRRFYTELTGSRDQAGDYLIYIDQPGPSKFCVVQIVGEYDYRLPESDFDNDFRSTWPARCCGGRCRPIAWNPHPIS